MRPTREPAILTVAAVRESTDGKSLECLFNERQQIYALPGAARTREAVLGRLREALDRNEPVKVVLNPRRGVVERVTEPTERERREFEKLRIPLENPDKPVRIDVSRIDPTTFNIVDYYLKFPTFALCRHTIPSYKVAKDIFDFCAAQSCHLPGPPAISHCIPFQYVRDGCYARAHKMRQVIEDQYGYCSEKVFSFALGNDDLAVRANKWGGCCVTWWYHVAPLVRVRVRIKLPPFINLDFQLAMVIDPSMFDKPVLLSTWLTAQEDKTCAPTAKVTTYSIQPSSAYTPSGGPGAYTTDPTYTLTHATLLNYKNLTTCP
jgi:Glutaminase